MTGAVGSHTIVSSMAGANGSAGPYGHVTLSNVNADISTQSMTSSTFGILGATGATGPIQPPSRLNVLSKPLPQLTRNITAHRRVYESDLLPPDIFVSFVRNRVIVDVASGVLFSDLPYLIERYSEWCDAHNAGLYMIEAMTQRVGIMISFEMDADLMQFNLGLR